MDEIEGVLTRIWVGVRRPRLLTQTMFQEQRKLRNIEGTTQKYLVCKLFFLRRSSDMLPRGILRNSNSKINHFLARKFGGLPLSPVPPALCFGLDRRRRNFCNLFNTKQKTVKIDTIAKAKGELCGQQILFENVLFSRLIIRNAYRIFSI